MLEQSHHIKTESGVRIKKSDLFPYLESNIDMEDLYEVSVQYLYSDDEVFIGEKRLRTFCWGFFIKLPNSKEVVNNYLESLVVN